jgi:hypothetical protein
MRIRNLCELVFSILPLVASAQIPDGPYLGQKPPGSEPKVFAPGLVSLPNRRDLKIVFSPDGQECFIGTAVNHKFTLLYTKLENGHWLEPLQTDFLGTQDKREPFISPDGEKLFFVGYWADIWMSTRIRGQWSAPSRLGGPINTDAEEWHPTMTSEGTLYFCSSRNAPAGGFNIYRSRLEDDQYKQVEKLDSAINSPQYGAWDPFIAPDESFMIFSSDRPGGFGNADQYISYHNQDGTWSAPQNLGSAINTSGIEYGSYVSHDGKYYFFSRPTGWGPDKEADIYWVDIQSIKRR